MFGGLGVPTRRINVLRARAFVVILPAIVVCATLSRLAAEEPESPITIAKGNKAVAIRVHKDLPLPEGVEARVAVDVVGEISEPIKTGIAILNVRILAVDTLRNPAKRIDAVLVELTPAQVEVFLLMEKHEMKIGIRLHEKQKSKQ